MLFLYKKFYGHTDLTMTKRYVRLAKDDVAKQHRSASPVNNFIKRTTRIKRTI